MLRVLLICAALVATVPIHESAADQQPIVVGYRDLSITAWVADSATTIAIASARQVGNELWVWVDVTRAKGANVTAAPTQRIANLRCHVPTGLPIVHVIDGLATTKNGNALPGTRRTPSDINERVKLLARYEAGAEWFSVEPPVRPAGQQP